MGNCLRVQEKVVKIVKTDGKFVEYKTPIKVHQVLRDFSGHAITSESLPELRHLHPNTQLVGGKSYNLVPAPARVVKKVRFAMNPQVQEAEEKEEEEESKVVRIKVVVSKKELENMLQQKGGISINTMLSLLHDQNAQVMCNNNTDDHKYGCQPWKPALESIPESN